MSAKSQTRQRRQPLTQRQLQELVENGLESLAKAMHAIDIMIVRVEALESTMQDRTRTLTRLSLNEVSREDLNKEFLRIRQDIAALVAMQSRLTLKVRELRRPTWRKIVDWVLNNSRSGL